MFFHSRNRELMEKLEDYFKITLEVLDEFVKAMRHVMANKVDEHFEVMSRRIHSKESDADDVRREIEQMMYAKSLLPESRGDILEILELLDHVPNQADSVVNMMLAQGSDLEDLIKADMKELVDISHETFCWTLEAARDCLGHARRLKELSRLIDNNESAGDRLETKMIHAVFLSGLGTAEKLIQKECIVEVGRICNHCERVKDRLVIAGIKRFA